MNKVLLFWTLFVLPLSLFAGGWILDGVVLDISAPDSGSMIGAQPNGVVRVSPHGFTVYPAPDNSNAGRGRAFADSYAAAADGDELILSHGIFEPSTPGLSTNQFLLNKTGITIRGQGRKTFFDGRMIYVATNGYIRDISFTNSFGSDVFVFYGNHSNRLFSTFENLWIYGSATSAHGVEFSGSDILVNNVHSFMPLGGSGHPFVLKGVSNVVVRNCSSTGGGQNGLLIKASSDSGKNLASNIRINGFVMRDSPTGIRLAPDNGDAVIENVQIDNVSGRGHVSGLWLGATGLIQTNNVIRATKLSNLHFEQVSSDAWIVSAANGDITISDASFGGANLPHHSINRLFNHPDITVLNVTAGPYRLKDGTIVQNNSPSGLSVIGVSTRRMYAGTVPLSAFSNALTRIHAEPGLSLTVAWSNTVFVNFDNLATNDPVWIEGGGGVNGFYFAQDWGTATATNLPVAGIGTGMHYVTVGYLGSSNGVINTRGHVHFGKLVGVASYASEMNFQWLSVDAMVSYTDKFYNASHRRRTYASVQTYTSPASLPLVQRKSLTDFIHGPENNAAFTMFADGPSTSIFFAVFGGVGHATYYSTTGNRFMNDVGVALDLEGSVRLLNNLVFLP